MNKNNISINSSGSNSTDNSFHFKRKDFLSEKDIKEHKELIKKISHKVISTDKYQKILFMLFSIASYACFLCITSYPTQKTLPEFICLNINQENKMYRAHGIDPLNNIDIDMDKIPTAKRNNLYSSLANLFNPPISDYKKIKIIKSEQCILNYCYPNEHQIKYHKNENAINTNSKASVQAEKAGSMNVNSYVKIIANYESLINWVTNYDAFCDYEEFFNYISVLINIARIIGSVVFSYVCDKLGRLVVFRQSVYQLLVFYLLILVFNSRSFFYIFIIIVTMNVNLYFAIVVMSSEMMGRKYFSILNSIISALFSTSGLLSLFVMVMLKNYFYFLYLQLIIISAIVYFLHYYIIETFAFSLANNKFEESLNNIYHLNRVLDLKIEDDKSVANDLSKLKIFIKKYYSSQQPEQIITDKEECQEYELNYLNCKQKTVSAPKCHVQAILPLQSPTTSIYHSKKNLLDFGNANDFCHNNQLFTIIYSDGIDLNKKLLSSPYKKLSIKNEKNKNAYANINSDNNGITTTNVNKSEKTDNFFDVLSSYMNLIFGPYFKIFMNKENIFTFLKFLPAYITVNLIYYGQLFYIEKISENVYLGIFIIYSSEITGDLLLTLYLHKTERKKAIYYCCILCAILYFIAHLFDHDILRMIMIFLGCIVLSFMYIVVYVIGAETFEIEIKTTMSSLLTNISCVALICFPYFVNAFGGIFFVFSLLCLITLSVNGYLKETNTQNSTNH